MWLSDGENMNISKRQTCHFLYTHVVYKLCHFSALRIHLCSDKGNYLVCLRTREDIRHFCLHTRKYLRRMNKKRERERER